VFGFGNFNKNSINNKKSTKNKNKSSFLAGFSFSLTKKNQPHIKNFQKSGQFNYKKPRECRTFAPSQQETQELVKKGTIGDSKSFQLTTLKLENFKNWFFALIGNFSRITSLFLTFGFLLSLVYFTFLDNSFTINSYTFSFTEGSYLNPDQINILSKVIQTQKQLGFLPQNQYWYINSPSLTLSVIEFLPQVKSVLVKNRTWSQKVELEITTEPALITLGIQEKDGLKFWRVSKDGLILGEDKAGLNQNLVIVRNPLSIINQDKNNFSEYLSLENYNFKNNQTQLNRFYFSIWLKELLLEFNFKNFSLGFPSLSDEDVVVSLVNGSQIYFNSTFFDPAVQSRRFQSVLSTNLDGQNTVSKALEQGQIHYLDLRIPKRVFICQTGSQCAE
jgi:hypothetical protein